MSLLLLVALSLQPADAPPPVAAAPPIEAVRPAGWRQIRKPAEARRPLPPIPLLVEQLGSPRYAERVAATRDLARAGAQAVAALRDAAKSDSPEVSIRAVAALEELWLRAIEQDDQATDAVALAALDDLSRADDPALSLRIESLLAAYASVVAKHAIDELRRLGATLKYNEGILITNDDGSMQPSILHVVIGAQWTGGEDGLRHIRRLPTGGPLGVYFITSAKLPEGAFARFQASVPREITVTKRGASYLGVQGSMFPVQGIEGCLVSRVEPNTPAAKAGIRDHDVIVQFNGRAVANFDQLVEEIKKTNPGDVIPATVLRESEPVEMKITMEEWK